jgi:hypothetical protein
VDNEMRWGGRFEVGYWLDDCHTWGVEGNYFFLGSRSTDFTIGCPAGRAVLARPFLNSTRGLQDAEEICFPGVARGGLQAFSSSRLQGFEANVDRRLCENCCSRVYLLGGFRYLELNEGLGIFEGTEELASAPVLPGSGFQVSDQFDTRTRFYGGEIGVRAESSWHHFFVNFKGLLALGVEEEAVRISGQTAITSPTGARMVVPAGLLALSGNSGRFRRNRFGVVPELGVNAGYQITSCLRAFVGYTFLFNSDVVRPGDQVDLALNERRIPTSRTFAPSSGPDRPAFHFQDSSFWVQGVNVGVELDY